MSFFKQYCRKKLLSECELYSRKLEKMNDCSWIEDSHLKQEKCWAFHTGKCAICILCTKEDNFSRCKMGQWAMKGWKNGAFFHKVRKQARKVLWQNGLLGFYYHTSMVYCAVGCKRAPIRFFGSVPQSLFTRTLIRRRAMHQSRTRLLRQTTMNGLISIRCLGAQSTL